MKLAISVLSSRATAAAACAILRDMGQRSWHSEISPFAQMIGDVLAFKRAGQESAPPYARRNRHWRFNH